MQTDAVPSASKKTGNGKRVFLSVLAILAACVLQEKKSNDICSVVRADIFQNAIYGQRLFYFISQTKGGSGG